MREAARTSDAEGMEKKMPLGDSAKKRHQIDRTRALLDQRHGAALAGFARGFYELGAAEDLSAYTEEALAGFAEHAWEFFAEHKRGGHRIRIINIVPEGSDNRARDETSIVEIVNDNMPFLVDSVMGELRAAGAEVRLVLHPMFHVERDGDGALKRCYDSKTPPKNRKTHRESFIHIHLDPIDTEAERDELVARLDEVLTDVRAAVVDWRPMLDRLSSSIHSYKNNPPPIPVDEIAEAVQFLQWLADDHFLLLGMREYRFSGGTKRGKLSRVEGSGMGILANPDVQVLRRGGSMVAITPEIRDFLLRPEPLIITKANVKSRIHRQAYMDYIGVKTFDEKGQLTGELRIVGLFTSTAYTHSVKRIPYLRQKIDKVLSQAGFDEDSHYGKAMMNVLESYPRDELFQIDLKLLNRFAAAILQLDERPRIRVLPRRDRFDRFVSVLVYVPRDRYSTAVRLEISRYLAGIYDGHLSAWYVAYPEGTLARVHFIIGRRKGVTPNPDQLELERAVTDLVRTWPDELAAALKQTYDPIRARLLSQRYGRAFSAAYREAYEVEDAVEDVGVVETLDSENATAIRYIREAVDAADMISLKLFNLAEQVPLSQRVPVLENTGFRVISERTYTVDPEGDRPMIYLHDMTLESVSGQPVDLAQTGDRLEALFMAIWNREAENDGFNALALTTDLDWRRIAVVRTLARYLRQARIPYSQDYMWGTLNRHADITAKIAALFEARFDPALAESDRELREAQIRAEIETLLEDVASLDDDRILRRFSNLVDAALRTNFYQRAEDGRPPKTIAIKFDSHLIDELPQPRPFREIFVYSARLEGVHLRFGHVARGGLRWSDRPQDFRTEVLGLVKAQQVKNAVIVPVGAKGGFVPKWLPEGGSRDEMFAEGTEAYKVFVSTLLDVTDNLDGDEVLPPEQVVRHDGDDPYLVVAADKGTATFSDTANGISEAHGFWLGDAFASGGSAGYDHKKMGITARGAWEAVKRHFREMDKDIQAEPFDVVGVGDMSGDVFGNGMLLSKAIRLIAAFDHRDIFIDPDPDPVASWTERKRVFELGRSSWQDYDTSLVSKGGGIFPRSLKSITLTKEMQDVLSLHKAKATPNEVLRAILTTKSDLLWFGGIGTYVRATGESDADVGDRANDAIRITASQVGAKVVGEGANLGMTQLARIAFHYAGGRCNSDAVDNSAGVNSSDLEVNIKIALGAAVRAGKLDIKKRNRFLASMTDQVAELCLRNNYLQTLAISLTEQQGVEDFGFQQRLMQSLEGRGLLDRTVEQLPDDAAMAELEKAGRILSRAEIGVLLAYAKIVLFDDILSTDVPDDPYLGRELVRYFPEKMQKTYSEEIGNHRLKREIVATMLANSMLNRGGATMLVRLADQTGATVAEITRSFAAARDSHGLSALNGEIDRLDNAIPGAVQLDLYLRVRDLLLDQIVWFLRNETFGDGIAPVVHRFGSGIKTLSELLPKSVPESVAAPLDAQADRWTEAGVPQPLAHRISWAPMVALAPDIILVAEQCGETLEAAAATYFSVAEHFRLARIDRMARDLVIADYYDGLALDRARQALAGAHRKITADSLVAGAGAGDGFGKWLEGHNADVARTTQTVARITEDDTLTVSRLAVAASLLADLATEGAEKGA